MILFHGTTKDNAHKICAGNFDLALCSRFLYGKGIYFSQCPNVALYYGANLIMCRVLPGLAQAKTKGATLSEVSRKSKENIDWRQFIYLHLLSLPSLYISDVNKQVSCYFQFNCTSSNFRTLTASRLIGTITSAAASR
jgi:hypothetical protein